MALPRIAESVRKEEEKTRGGRKSDPSVDHSVCYARLKQMGNLCGGNGLAEEVALSFHTVPGLEECELLLCFDALGNHALFKVLAHINYGADDWRVVGIGGNPVDKGLVNFQNINGKLLKITKAGIAGAEVIHYKAHPHRLELSKYGSRGFRVLHQNAFGELEIEMARIQASFPQGRPDTFDKTSIAEFESRNIDGNPFERQTRVLPFACLFACFAQHPTTDLDN